MRFAIWALAILIVLEGIVLLIKPQFYAKFAGFFTKGKLPFIAALLKAAFGVFLLIAATSCDIPLIIIILGLITAGAGFTMMGMESGKLKKMFQWWIERPFWAVRIMAIAAIAIAALMLYAAGIPQ